MNSVLRKVPEITLAFWVMKICATTLGETAGDLLSMTLHVGYAVSSMILISAFLVTLLGQLWSKTYHPLLYWAVILSTSTAGTTMSDFMDRTLGLVVLAKYATRISTVFLFWVAFILTRPFGATFGDLLTKPLEKGGLGFGTVGSSVILAVILVVLVGVAMWKIRRVERRVVG